MTPDAPVRALAAAAYRVPTDAPEADGTLAWDSTTLVTCEIQAGGETGFGYAYADAATARFLQTTIAKLLEGREALDVAARWRDMVDGVRNHGARGIAATAVSAADAALHDLRAKLLGAPLCRLLGRRTDAVAGYGSGGFTTYDDRRMEAQLGRWAEEGFAAVKIKIGEGPTKDLARIRLARRIVGDNVALMIDANGAYTPKEGLLVAEAAAGEGVIWFEEPVSSDDLPGLRLVREQGPAGMAVAAGEYGYHAGHFRRMLEAGAVDALQADAGRCLGITGFLQADALAWAFGAPLSAHTAPSLHVHPAVCCQRLRHIEWFHDHVRIEAMLIDGAPEPRDGEVSPDLSRPGLGLALKRADAEPFRVWPEGSA